MQALPTCFLEPQTLAYIYGFSGDWASNIPKSLSFLEPPAGLKEPFLDPLNMLTDLYVHHGMDRVAAETLARNDYLSIQPHLEKTEKVVYIDLFDATTSECIPAFKLVPFLDTNIRINKRVVAFLKRAIDVAITTPIFEFEEARGTYYPLSSRPVLPPP